MDLFRLSALLWRFLYRSATTNISLQPLIPAVARGIDDLARDGANASLLAALLHAIAMPARCKAMGPDRDAAVLSIMTDAIIQAISTAYDLWGMASTVSADSL